MYTERVSAYSVNLKVACPHDRGIWGRTIGVVHNNTVYMKGKWKLKRRRGENKKTQDSLTSFEAASAISQTAAVMVKPVSSTVTPLSSVNLVSSASNSIASTRVGLPFKVNE